MIDISLKWEKIILTHEKKEIVFWFTTKEVWLDNLDVNFPWEYEKAEMLLEVKEFESELIYKFYVEGYNIVIVTKESFDTIENILSFFGDVDLLILPWTKNAIKLYENIEAKIVLPYGEGKDVFLNSLGQHKEEVQNFRIKWEILWDTTEFINLV